MNSLALVNNKMPNASIWESTEELALIKESFGRNLAVGEWNMLVQMGKATGLNPFLKEIWAVKYGTTAAQVFIGRDGYRKSAQRHPLYDYHISDAVYSGDEFQVVDGEIKHKYNLTNRGELVGAYCIVKRKGSSRSSYVYVELKEYSTGQSLWSAAGKGKPATMIKKVAEAQALKSAFQELFAGTYSEYEAFDKATDITPPGKGVNGLKERLALSESEIAETEEVTNEETGEVAAPIATNEMDVSSVIFLIEAASDEAELMQAVGLMKTLTDTEKLTAKISFMKRKKELSGK